MTKHSISIHIHETFGSVDDMLTKDEQKIVLDAYNDALKEALTYIQGALPEGYTPTQLFFGNPFYTSIGTERPDLDRYDPDRFGPHLFNISVDFIDGDSPKVAFRVDTVDPKTGDTTLQRKLVYVDPFVEDFLEMKKPAFRLLPSDADKLADATKKAFKKTESHGPVVQVLYSDDFSGQPRAQAYTGKSVWDVAKLWLKDPDATIAINGVRNTRSFDKSRHDIPDFEFTAGDIMYSDTFGDLYNEYEDVFNAMRIKSVDDIKRIEDIDNGIKVERGSVMEAAQYRVSVNFTPEPPFGYGDQDFLFKGLDIVDEEFSFPTREEAESFAQDCANRITARNQDLESDGLQDGEIRIYYTNRDYVDRMVRNAGKAYAALWQDYDPENPPFPVLVARIGITKE